MEFIQPTGQVSKDGLVEDTAQGLSPAGDSSGDDSSSFKRFLLDAFETIAIALVIFFVIYFFVAQPHLVKGQSMLPNHVEGEYILTNKVYTWLGSPSRGDIIVFTSPDNPSENFIKRIIGLPGEKIKLENNTITISNDQHPNGFVLREDYLPENLMTEARVFLSEGKTVDIPADHYVTMGDNRPASYDSRDWGFVEKQKIIGQAFFIYWPLTRFGFVAHAHYNE